MTIRTRPRGPRRYRAFERDSTVDASYLGQPSISEGLPSGTGELPSDCSDSVGGFEASKTLWTETLGRLETLVGRLAFSFPSA